MSALLTPRRPRRGARREKPREQESLFAAAAPAAPPLGAPPAAPQREAAPAAPQREGASVAAPCAVPAAEPTITPSAHRQGPTLDDLVAGAWEGLLAGAPASCVVCGTTMHPRYSGGHAAVGGRCTGCGTTLG
jgi:hypothetical protein